MKNVMSINIVTNDCDLDRSIRQGISRELEDEVKRFNDHSQIELSISKLNECHWTFDVSMKYARGHVATSKNAVSLESAIQDGINEFKSDLRTHEFQWSIETFHFDKTSEYDYYKEVSQAILPSPQRKLKALVLEDDPAAAVVLKATLETYGCKVHQSGMPQNALQALVENRFDLLILDWNLPYMKGGEFLTAADLLLAKADREGRPRRQIPVVICTSMPLGNITIPDVSHFFVVNYWHKSLPYSSILGSLDETTKKVSVRNQFAA